MCRCLSYNKFAGTLSVGWRWCYNVRSTNGLGSLFHSREESFFACQVLCVCHDFAYSLGGRGSDGLVLTWSSDHWLGVLSR